LTFVHLASDESKLEKVISYLLSVGVIISLFLEVVGLIFFYEAHGHLNISEEGNMFVQGHNFFSFLYELSQIEFVPGGGILFMIVGIVILILTPYIRVITSVLFFVWQRNIKYVLITFFVLVVLTLSLTLH
jgi:uncharacterized membrane protein